MTKGIVLSLYDFTGEALKPWAKAGYTCHAFDIQHDEAGWVDRFDGGGSIRYWKVDLWNSDNITAHVTSRQALSVLPNLYICMSISLYFYQIVSMLLRLYIVLLV